MEGLEVVGDCNCCMTFDLLGRCGNASNYRMLELPAQVKAHAAGNMHTNTTYRATPRLNQAYKLPFSDSSFNT